MPSVLEVKAQKDFWERLYRTRPVRAISELVWNSFDADADEVSIAIEKNLIDGIERIRVSDNGTGIPFDAKKHQFSTLGGSWKSQTTRTLKQKRILHGKNGQGRFRAFALGERVSWSTRHKANGQVTSYEITGSSIENGIFRVGDPKITRSETTGTIVLIENIDKSAYELL